MKYNEYYLLVLHVRSLIVLRPVGCAFSFLESKMSFWSSALSPNLFFMTTSFQALEFYSITDLPIQDPTVQTLSAKPVFRVIQYIWHPTSRSPQAFSSVNVLLTSEAYKNFPSINWETKGEREGAIVLDWRFGNLDIDNVLMRTYNPVPISKSAFSIPCSILLHA